jgi:hypothetical protein
MGKYNNMSRKPEEIVQQQVDAYINLNLDEFVDCYADDVVTFDLAQNEGKGTIGDNGKEELTARFQQIFNHSKSIQCNILKRMVQGKMVVDHEHVVKDNNIEFYSIAMYWVENEKIQKFWFHAITT